MCLNPKTTNTIQFRSKISWPLERLFDEIFMGQAQHVKCIMFIMIDIFKIWWLHLDQRGVLRAQKNWPWGQINNDV